MSTYVMSDIHGCFDEFMSMLDKIGFSDEDQLILAGDYVDRGAQNLKMLRWIEDAPMNILPLKGNHDLEFAENVHLLSLMAEKLSVDCSKLEGGKLLSFFLLVKEQIHSPMFDHYGTIEALLTNEMLTFQDFLGWKQIIDDMPYYFRMKMKGRDHVIVHAGYAEQETFRRVLSGRFTQEEFYVYAREEAVYNNGLRHMTVVAGHTPTILSGIQYNDGRIYRYYDRKNNYEYFDIDCGCVYRLSGYGQGRLACLRLEDRKEFYLK